jgi:hypothetical protein
MTTPDSSGQTDRIVRSSLVIAPAFLFASGAVLPSLNGPDGTQLSLAASHADAFYMFVVFGILGSIFLIPASLGLSARVAASRPLLGWASAVLLVVGDCLALVDWGTELVKWQMGVAGSDPKAMASLAAQVDSAPGVTVPLQLSGLAFLAGMVVVAVGLVHARTAPVWASIGLPVVMLVNLAGFASGSILILDIGAAGLLVCLTVIALRGWASQPAPTPAPASAVRVR